MKAVHGLDLMLLQEARFSDALDSMAGFPFVAAANLKLPRYCSGVVTAAKAPADHSRFHLTYAKEPFILTPKNSLITIYRFRDNTGLAVVNIHAINFRSSAWYQWELARLAEVLKGYSGSMVLAGDFNCWQSARQTALEQFSGSLGLTLAMPDNLRLVKQAFGQHLDRMYYRCLKLETVEAVACRQISDHNPIIARFARIE